MLVSARTLFFFCMKYRHCNLYNKKYVHRTSRIYAYLCVAKNNSHLMHVEGVDTLRSVRNNDVCVRIIVGDLANVTRDFPRPEPRRNDVKRGATGWEVGMEEGRPGERGQQPRLIKTADGN